MQVCTGVMLHGYPMVKRLCGELQTFMSRHGFTSIADFTGASLPYFTTHQQLVALQREAIDHRKKVPSPAQDPSCGRLCAVELGARFWARRPPCQERLTSDAGWETAVLSCHHSASVISDHLDSEGTWPPRTPACTCMSRCRHVWQVWEPDALQGAHQQLRTACRACCPLQVRAGLAKDDEWSGDGFVREAESMVAN